MKTLNAITIAACMVSSTTHAIDSVRFPTDADYSANYITERTKIVDVVGAVGLFADLGRWDDVKAQFADDVILGYTSHASAVAGREAGKPETMKPDQIIAAWKTVLPGYAYTQHLITNPTAEIDGDEAHVLSQIHATHYLPNSSGDNYWIVVGT